MTTASPPDDTSEFRVEVRRDLAEEFKSTFPFYGFVRMTMEAFLEELIAEAKANPNLRDHARNAAKTFSKKLAS